MPDLTEQLRALVALAEKATPGEFTVKYGVNIMAGDGYSATSLESNLFTEDRNAANAALLVAAANFIRTHGPALLAAAEGVERDAARYRWIRACDSAGEQRVMTADGRELKMGHELDTAIDAALNGGQDDA